MFFTLAWRNLWRNKRRTWITTGSLIFAVFLALFMRSMQEGSYDHMVRTAVGLYTGYLQVHGKGFWEERSFDNSFVEEGTRAQSLRVPHVTALAPRLDTFALAAVGSITKGVLLTGIDPAGEDSVSGLRSRVVAGRYLSDADQGVLIAEGLANYLGVKPGDELVVLGQGYQGGNAAAKLTVQGLVHFGAPDLNEGTVFMSLRAAQNLFSAPERLTSYALMLDNARNLGAVRSRLEAAVGGDFEVMTWEEMMPELVQAIAVDSAGGVLMLILLYVVIGFGLLATVMMMVVERRREFGMLVAVGLRPARLRATVVLESVLIAMCGAALGMVASLPVLLHLHSHPLRLSGGAAEGMTRLGFEPIFPFSIEPRIFLVQGAVVLGLGLIAAMYPAWAAGRSAQRAGGR
jgi:putative ABC transport system permease protein